MMNAIHVYSITSRSSWWCLCSFLLPSLSFYVKTFIALYDKGICILGAPETDYAGGGGEYGQQFAYATRSHGKHYGVDSGIYL